VPEINVFTAVPVLPTQTQKDPLKIPLFFTTIPKIFGGKSPKIVLKIACYIV
jgi:hypothetical protein